MDHADALAALQLAAIEPGRLDRLAAGDTPEAALLAGHLAACGACRLELERLRRVGPLVREAVSATPDPELRERTLSYVRAMGRPREAAVPTAAGPAPRAGARAGRPYPRPALWLGSLAAAAALAVVLTASLLPTDRAALQREQSTSAGLADVATAMTRLMGQPDLHRIELVDATSTPQGVLMVSPASGEVLMETGALQPPAAGQAYRCWLETGGTRRQIGWLEFGGGLAYWAGRVDGLQALRPGDRFGVSLVGAQASAAGGPPSLVGTY